MREHPTVILAIDNGVALEKRDRDRLRRAGVIVISAPPDRVRAIEVTPLAPMNQALRAAVETLMEDSGYGHPMLVKFARKFLGQLAASTAETTGATE